MSPPLSEVTNTTASNFQRRVDIGTPTSGNSTPSVCADVREGPAAGVGMADDPVNEDKDEEYSSSEADSDDDDDEIKRDRLSMSEDDKQALIDRVLEAMGNVDHYAEMLDGGPEGRPLGQPYPGVSEQRIQIEKESLEEIIEIVELECIDLSEAEIEETVRERSKEWRQDYEDELNDIYEDCCQQASDLQEQLEAAGISLTALLQAVKQHESSTSSTEAMQAEESGASVGSGAGRCEQCGRSAVLTETNGQGSSSSQRLCYVCSAEKELNLRSPVRLKHGKVMEKGASGFNGWTHGLRRTNNQAVLKRMYKAKRPAQVKQIEQDLQNEMDLHEGEKTIEEALGIDDVEEVDELDSEEGAPAVSMSESSGDEGEEGFGSMPAVGSKRFRRMQSEALQTEGEDCISRKHRANKDKNESHRPLDSCTCCSHPFYEYVAVYEHPTLGVALCYHCHSIIKKQMEDANSDNKPLNEEGDDDKCSWCWGLNDDDGENELLGCERDGCVFPLMALVEDFPSQCPLHFDNRCLHWFCHSCIARNLGIIAVENIREESPWSCFVCNPDPLDNLRNVCAISRAKRQREKKRVMKRKAESARKRQVPLSRSVPSTFLPHEHSKTRPPKPIDDNDDSQSLLLWPAQQMAGKKGNDSNAQELGALPAVSVASKLAKHLKPHQIDAVRFMWSACLGQKRPDTNKRLEHGVVLAHSMGLGKTLSVCTFLHTVLTRAYDGAGIPYVQYRAGREPTFAKGTRPDPPTALVLVPKALTTQWEREFRRWVGNDDELRVDILGAGLGGGQLMKLRAWKYMGGVLIMNHDAFWRMLSPVSGRGARQDENSARELLEFGRHLLNPGPDVIVIDEAHRIKNNTTSLSKALGRVSTRRRILLTGTPLQNNLLEYFHMVDYAKPGYLGDEKRFKQLYEERIRVGQTRDKAEHHRQMNRRVWALTQKLDQLVQRRGFEILQAELPPRLDVVVIVRLAETQRLLYNFALERVQGGGKLFSQSHNLRRVFNHPAMLALYAANSTKQQKVATVAEGCEDEVMDGPFDGDTWWQTIWPTHVLQPDEIFQAHLSGKVMIMLEILRQATIADEKVLLFSQSLETLTVIEEVLQRTPSPRSDNLDGFWQKGLDYLRFDGTTQPEERDIMVNHFNNADLHTRLFLISTKAGGQGLNLAAASRVIVFDASWNPANDTQAVYRAYRYGQTRPVVVYRLIAEGFEDCMYKQQVHKLQLAGRVLDEQTLEATYTQEELRDLWRPVLLTPGAPKPEIPSNFSREDIEKSWIDQLGMSNSCGDRIVLFKDHARALEDTEEELTSREKEDAANEFVRDANLLPRLDAMCSQCSHLGEDVTFAKLTLACKKCGAKTLLPPAAPLVQRCPSPGHLMFHLHGEDDKWSKSSLLPEGGVYHLQWREVDPQKQVDTEDDWVDPKKPMRPGLTISKRNLSVEKQYQARVRARMGPCTCGCSAAPDTAYLQCAEKGECKWTPWSQPSVLATPLGEGQSL